MLWKSTPEAKNVMEKYSPGFWKGIPEAKYFMETYSLGRWKSTPEAKHVMEKHIRSQECHGKNAPELSLQSYAHKGLLPRDA